MRDDKGEEVGSEMLKLALEAFLGRLESVKVEETVLKNMAAQYGLASPAAIALKELKRRCDRGEKCFAFIDGNSLYVYGDKTNINFDAVVNIESVGGAPTLILQDMSDDLVSEFLGKL